MAELLRYNLRALRLDQCCSPSSALLLHQELNASSVSNDRRNPCSDCFCEAYLNQISFNHINIFSSFIQALCWVTTTNPVGTTKSFIVRFVLPLKNIIGGKIPPSAVTASTTVMCRLSDPAVRIVILFFASVGNGA